MNNLSITILNTEECYMLNKRLINVFETDLEKEAAVSKVMPNLIELNADLSAILERTNQNAMTKQLAAKDEERNAAFINFRDYCKAYTSEPDPILSAAAKKLTALIREIGWTLYQQGYTEQTASQEALVNALAEPEYAEAITAINATARVSYLQSTNMAFEESLRIKTEIKSRKDIPFIRECKREMVRYLKPLLVYLKLMADVKPDVYSAAVAKIDEAVEYVMTVARARQTRKENLKTKPNTVEALAEPEKPIESAA